MRVRRRSAQLTSFILVALTAGAGVTATPAAALDARTFYVDCANGSDTATGASQSAAWRTVARAGAIQSTGATASAANRGRNSEDGVRELGMRAKWGSAARAPTH